MAQLLVRNIEDEIVERLRARAARHGRSVEAEHRELLREALLRDRGVAEFKARAARIRAMTPGRPQTPAEVLQREGRDER
jgi:plasmid stability protein